MRCVLMTALCHSLLATKLIKISQPESFAGSPAYFAIFGQMIPDEVSEISPGDIPGNGLNAGPLPVLPDRAGTVGP